MSEKRFMFFPAMKDISWDALGNMEDDPRVRAV